MTAEVMDVGRRLGDAHSASRVFLLEGVPEGYRAEQTVAKLFAPAE